jgi:hypothetical protein
MLRTPACRLACARLWRVQPTTNLGAEQVFAGLVVMARIEKRTDGRDANCQPVEVFSLDQRHHLVGCG